MKKYLIFLTLPCMLIVPMIFVYQSTIRNANVHDAYFMKRFIAFQSCEKSLLKFNTSVPFLLIDLHVLKEIHDSKNTKCHPRLDRPLKIGVDEKHLSSKWLFEDSRFEVVYFSNRTENDFLDFKSEPRRIIPKKFDTRWVGNIEIPTNIPRMIGFWERSKYSECMNLYIPREGQNVVMPAGPSSKALATLRDELIENDMFPFLNGGTLLGWYRECSVIPHSLDMDIAVFADNYNSGFLENVEKNLSEFRIFRKLGMINDSFELTVTPKHGFKLRIDLFLMYEGVENGTVTHNWVGGVSRDGDKYKCIYPVYDPWCAADLQGHIFWVTCSPNEKITAEYGQLWYQDHLSTNYSWKTTAKNVKENGKWTKEQMIETYQVFKIPG